MVRPMITLFPGDESCAMIKCFPLDHGAPVWHLSRLVHRGEMRISTYMLGIETGVRSKVAASSPWNDENIGSSWKPILETPAGSEFNVGGLPENEKVSQGNSGSVTERSSQNFRRR